MKPTLIALLLLTSTAAPVAAHDFKIGTLEVKHPWSRVAPAAAPVLGGYVIIVNTGTESDRLIGGSAAVAAKFELHTSVIEDGVAKMRPARDGIEIAPGQTVKLEPGGAHIMLVQPSARPAKGEKFAGTLVFEKAGTLNVEFAVQDAAPQPASTSEHQGHVTTP